jgi:IS1 family transposase
MDKKGAKTAHKTITEIWHNLRKRRAHEIDIDEQWTYLESRTGKKRMRLWIWTALADDEFVFTVGSRGEDTLLEFLSLLPDVDVYCTDGYDVYDRCLPAGRHVVDRAGVNRNEGKHSALRDYLVRLKRGTKA